MKICCRRWKIGRSLLLSQKELHELVVNEEDHIVEEEDGPTPSPFIQALVLRTMPGNDHREFLIPGLDPGFHMSVAGDGCHCHYCGKPLENSSKARWCGNCKITPYCGKECQRAYWKFHKKTGCLGGGEKDEKIVQQVEKCGRKLKDFLENNPHISIFEICLGCMQSHKSPDFTCSRSVLSACTLSTVVTSGFKQLNLKSGQKGILVLTFQSVDEVNDFYMKLIACAMATPVPMSFPKDSLHFIRWPFNHSTSRFNWEQQQGQGPLTFFELTTFQSTGIDSKMKLLDATKEFAVIVKIDDPKLGGTPYLFSVRVPLIKDADCHQYGAYVPEKIVSEPSVFSAHIGHDPSYLECRNFIATYYQKAGRKRANGILFLGNILNKNRLHYKRKELKKVTPEKLLTFLQRFLLGQINDGRYVGFSEQVSEGRFDNEVVQMFYGQHDHHENLINKPHAETLQYISDPGIVCGFYLTKEEDASAFMTHTFAFKIGE